MSQYLQISAKFIKMSANITDYHLANITSEEISKSRFSENSKTETVRPIFKKED